MSRFIAFRRFLWTVLALCILVGIMVVGVGALSVHNTDDKINITIDKDQLKEKAQEGVQKAEDAGRAVLRRTGEAMKKAGDKIRTESDATKPADPDKAQIIKNEP